MPAILAAAGGLETRGQKTKSLRDGRATAEAQLKLLEHDGHICLEIADNGGSFHPDHAAEARKNGRLGLASMRERAEMLGGKLEIKADAGNGTIVKAAVAVCAGSGK